MYLAENQNENNFKIKITADSLKIMFKYYKK